MKKVKRLCFLEDRTYLQGTTLYEFLVDTFVPSEQHSLKVNRMIYSDNISIQREVGEHASATFLWQEEKQDKVAYIYQEDKSLNPIILPFDEQKICAQAFFSTGQVNFTEHEGSFIKTCVALNKRLISMELPNYESPKWIFNRLDMQKINSPGCDYSIIFQRETRRLACSHIYENQKHIGTLYFNR